MKKKPLVLGQEGVEDAGRALLLERSQRLRGQKKTEEIAGDGGWIAEFNVGGQAFALPLEQVVSAGALKGVTPVPMAKRGVIGILRHEGRVIRVLSLASVLGSGGWRRDPAVLLILRLGGECLAVDCEEIPRVAQLRTSVWLKVHEESGRSLVELNLPGGRLLRYLNLQALLASVEGGSDHE